MKASWLWLVLCAAAALGPACGEDRLPRFARPPAYDGGRPDAGPADSGEAPEDDAGE